MTYVYVCESCNIEFETKHSMLIEAYTVCPLCYSNTLKRKVIGGTGFIKVSGGQSPGRSFLNKVEDIPFISVEELIKAENEFGDNNEDKNKEGK